MKGKRVFFLFFSSIMVLLSGFLFSSIVVLEKPQPAPLSKDQTENTHTQTVLGQSNQQEVTDTVVVTTVLDGDTVQISTGEKVRYLGINTPEKGQPYAQQAQETNKQLVLNKNVRLAFDVQQKDKYDRLLAYVYIDSILVNLEMVKKGLAISETIQPNVKFQDEIFQAQKEARAACAGIWHGLCSEDQNGGQANSCITILTIVANPSGDDTVNKNGEFIEFKNTCATTISMDTWLLKDSSASNSYTFQNFNLASEKSVKLHSGCGTNTTTDLYWQCPEQKFAIWNNTGDHAFLYNERQELVGDYQY